MIKDAFKELKSHLKNLHLKVIGFEKDRTTYEFIEKIRSKDYKLFGVSQPLKNLRLIKGLSEVESLKKSVEITDKIFKELISFLLPGKTELEIRGKIVELAFKWGAEGESFPAIVATSSHSAIPHWETSQEKIKNNAPLLIDMGVIFNGYCSDFTRTLYIGKADKEFKYYYELVKTAWFKAFERVKEGVPIYELDKVVRSYFESKGVLSYFTHALGHGIGIEIHEHPRVYYKKQKKWLKEYPLIKDGMVFTIEPGLYFSGKYGIRLENIVFVEKGEGKIYSEIPLELIEL